MAAGSDNAPLIAIVGETASGKSELAMQIAEKFNSEIIAADSWTVYKDFNIGTAKPSAQERARVPHHLLDIADPRKGFSAAEYKRLTVAASADISSRGKLPILVGGTGLYIDSVLFDYSFLPPATPEIRVTLNSLSIEELLQKILEADLDTLGLDLRNKRRLIRLLETNGARATRGELRPNTLIIGVQIPHEKLREQITTRVDAMLTAGLENEVAQLAQKYGWNVEPMKGIGYGEFHDYFNGTQSLEQTRERVIGATVNLAKKQRTWFKRNYSIHWISKQAEVVELVTTFLNK
ncbi:MAG TPA: tRNA (adenosine(37)-N6)-dimethylallyltransferase MiaA [Candidatus Saccharimonadales bacterium]